MPDTARVGTRIGRNPGSRGLSSVTFVSHPLPFSRVAQEVGTSVTPSSKKRPPKPQRWNSSLFSRRAGILLARNAATEPRK
jgi:hypothetical protein